jgi:hypothetical protein
MSWFVVILRASPIGIFNAQRAGHDLCPACPGDFKQETSSWRIVHAIHIIFHSAMGEYAV